MSSSPTTAPSTVTKMNEGHSSRARQQHARYWFAVHDMRHPFVIRRDRQVGADYRQDVLIDQHQVGGGWS